MQRVEELGALTTDGMSSLHSSHEGSGIFVEEKEDRVYEPEVVEDSKETDTTALMYMSSHGLW